MELRKEYLIAKSDLIQEFTAEVTENLLAKAKEISGSSPFTGTELEDLYMDVVCSCCSTIVFNSLLRSSIGPSVFIHNVGMVQRSLLREVANIIFDAGVAKGRESVAVEPASENGKAG